LKKNTLFTIFIALWMSDTVLSLMFINNNTAGIMSECNPILRFVFVQTGAIGFIGFKTLPLLFFAPMYKRIHNWIYYGFIVIMMPVVYAGAHMAFWPV
jgi:hypothetical protein